MLKWVLQDNLIKEDDITKIVVQLERQCINYSLVRLIPFGGSLETDINYGGIVFVYGSSVLTQIAKQKGWLCFDDNLDMALINKGYGNLMLNSDAKEYKLGEVDTNLESFFIRPCLDTKSFSGQVMTQQEFHNWRNRIKLLVEHGDYCSLTLEDRVIVSPIKEIYTEYRFFIVNGKISTYSMYKKFGNLYTQGIVDESVIVFVNKALKIYQPNKAFVLDVADTPNGFKIIECNSIHSSGIYNINVGLFVNSISTFMGEFS